MRSGEHLGPAEMRTVVLLAVGILAAVAGPSIEGRTAKAKWFEARVSAMMIQRSVRNYAVKTNVDAAQALAGKNLGGPTIQRMLDVSAMRLEDGCFTASDYTICSVDSDGYATIRVTGSKANAPRGSYVFDADGDWVQL